MKRVAYLVSEYPAVSHTFVAREVFALRDRGWDVLTASIRSVTSWKGICAADRAASAGTFSVKGRGFVAGLWDLLCFKVSHPVAFFRMWWKAWGLRGWKGWAYLVEAVILVRWMEREGVDHVHCHLANPAATVAMCAGWSGLITWSVSVHGPDVFDNVEANYLPRKLREATFVRCISDYCQSQVERWLPFRQWGRVHVVRCGLRKGAGGESVGGGGILSVGRLVGAKGFPVLLEACRLLRDVGRDFHLKIVGGGPERSLLEGLIQEYDLSGCVELVGRLDQEQLAAYYERADIFVLPSFAEGVPTVLMEAMSWGVPVVATAVAGVTELVEDGVSGLVVPASNVESLAEAMGRLLGSEGDRRNLGSEARKKVAELYDVDQNVIELEALFICDHF